MFSFDGDFRRRPQQNLGGASQKSVRDELIRKAQVERQKREDARRRHNGAIIIQSHIRGFLLRKREKNTERKNYENYLNLMCFNEIKNFENLEYLLKRFLFFYNIKNLDDCKKLITLSQFMLKNSQNIIIESLNNLLWQYRIRKLLKLCMNQIFIAEISSAIPFRMLEVFSSHEELLKISCESKFKIQYLENIFYYLIKNEYFKIIRRLIDEKIPMPDEETVNPPNEISKTILDLLFRPLKLIDYLKTNRDSNKILNSFLIHILSNIFSNQVKFFILPSISLMKNFPFIQIIRLLSHLYEKPIELDTMLLDDIIHCDKRKMKRITEEPIFSSYLLYSILKLDNNFLANPEEYSSDYIKIIALLSNNLMKLPKKFLQNSNSSNDNETSDSDDEDKSEQKTISTNEYVVLQEILKMLNDTKRIEIIVNEVDKLLENSATVLYICIICQNLMNFKINNKLLTMLAFKPQFIRIVWCNLTYGQKDFASPISLLSKGISISKSDSDKIVPLLATFCLLFGRLIPTLHDGEFCHEDVLPGSVSKIMPFTLDEIIPLSTTLKEISLGLVELAFPETRLNLHDNYRSALSSISDHNDNNLKNSNEIINKNIWPNLLKVCNSLLRQIYTRDLRRGFCPENHWTAQALNLPLDKPTDLHMRREPRPFQPIQDFTRDDIEDGPPMSTKQIRSITILREIPFVVPFNARVGILQGLLAADKLRIQGDPNFQQGPSIQISVRRSHLYEDAFDRLCRENELDLRYRFRVQMVNMAGLDEAGIDGGGVFREFLSELLREAFDPRRGFFLTTTDNKLYPNPSAELITEDYQRHYYFIGRILGKALYENLLVELPLAEFFLSKLAGKHSDVDVHQLASLDPVLHKNLLSLKAYENEVAELGLDFTVVCDQFGERNVKELKPNGANITVTSSNKIEYIRLMADFKLNKQIRKQCLEFRKGLANVLPIEWLYMFSNKELQVLISGAEIPVDIEDLKRHTKYGGDFSVEHQTIIYFWRVVESFDDRKRRQLLKFVTSCSRPPLLGFKDLDPPFHIQNAGDTDRLPSASTCMNLLKLPEFDSEQTLKEKLLYAIQSGSGFELS